MTDTSEDEPALSQEMLTNAIMNAKLDRLSIRDGFSDSNVATSTGLSTTSNFFQKLPPEIFGVILQLVISDPSAHGAKLPQARRLLAGVCKTWRDMVLGIPSLWTHITSADLLSQALRLSGEMSLDIDIIFPRQGKHAENFEIIRVLGEHSHRWRRLAVTGSRTVIARALLILKSSMPALEHLELRSVDSLQDLRLELEDAPLLRVLWLNVVAPSPDLSELSSLKVLSLHSIIAPRISVSTILRILASCSQLEDLHLSHLAGNLNPDVQPLENHDHPLSQIPLKRLARMDIENVHASIILPLLCKVFAPALRTFSFSRTSNAYETDEPRSYEGYLVSEGLPKFIRTILQNNPGEEVVLDALMGDVKFSCGEQLSIVLGNVDFDLRHLLILIQGSKPGHIPVSFSFDFHAREDSNIGEMGPLLILPVNMINIRCLHLVAGDKAQISWICDYLGTRLHGTVSWGCPGMEKLKITADESISTDEVLPLVRRMFARRYSIKGNQPTKMVVEYGEKLVLNEYMLKFQEKGAQGVVTAAGPVWTFGAGTALSLPTAPAGSFSFSFK